MGGEFSTYMPKSTVTFMCSECGGESLRWAGQCPHCQAWNTLQEFQVRKAPPGRKQATSRGAPNRPVPLNEIESESSPRRRLAWGELNRVLGGGVVPGSVVLVGGEPGVGKSTLLMHVAQQIAGGDGGKVLYASGEESPQQIALVENCSHQKITPIATAPATRSVPRTAASDLIKSASARFGLI